MSPAPDLKPSQTTIVDLAHGGASAVWDSGPTDSATAPVVLLHGWNVNSFVNYGWTFDAIAEHRRVIAIDHRGHGNGPRSGAPFALETCVNDVLGVLDGLGIETATLLGYSLGGAVAQLTAHRAPERVAGLVLAATAEVFCADRSRRLQFRGLAAAARAMRTLPPNAQEQLFRQITTVTCARYRYPTWIRDQVLHGEPVSLLEAGAALGGFDSSSWVASLRAPAAVVVTARDSVVSPRDQYRLAEDIDAVVTLPIDGDHDTPIHDNPQFSEILLHALAALEQHRSKDATLTLAETSVH